MILDLHMHSTASDGQYCPADLATKVKGEGISLMALTDHDSVGGVEEAQAKAKELGITCISGIELSIRYETEFHMLGLGIDVHCKRLAEFCNKLVEDRNTRGDRILTYLEGYGIKLDMKDVLEFAGANVLARPHFARAMVKSGYVASVQEAFDKYLATEEFKKIERPKPTAEEGISMIHEAGGLAIMAHPISLKKEGDEFEAELKRVVDLGLDGMETYYSTHTPEHIAFYHSLAEKYHLLETAGADFHGENVKPTIFLGKKVGGEELLASEEVFDQIASRLLERIG